MLKHGGQIYAAAETYGIPVNEWLDLSTGINPVPFIPPNIPSAIWQHLPQDQDGLPQAATDYYGSNNLLPIAGSQAAIQLLPHLREPCRVGILHPAYAEHAHAWRSTGNNIINLASKEITSTIDNLDVLVLLQPNNPTGETFTLSQLQNWHHKLQSRKGWLIVDEAFIEATSQHSMIQPDMPAGLIVLRSLGKFFGLAGARVGFIFAAQTLLIQIQQKLGPWTVTGPSRFVAQAALRDNYWQKNTRLRLKLDSSRLSQLLQNAQLTPSGGCGLFQWVLTTRAEFIHRQLAQHGILTRLFSHPSSLRFGLPGTEANWLRLQSVLATISNE